MNQYNLKYTKESLQYISENYKRIPDDRLCLELKEKFGISVKPNNIKQTVCRHHLPHALAKPYRISSPEIDSYVKENYKNYMSVADFTNDLNNNFGTCLNVEQVKGIAKRMRACLKGNTGRYKQGECHPRFNVGDEIDKDGWIWVKIYNTDYDYFKSWKAKHVLIWEQVNGKKVGENEIVTFLDGNRRNFNPDNLYCIPRSVHGIMCKNGLYSDDPEITKTNIVYAEFILANSKFEKENIKNHPSCCYCKNLIRENGINHCPILDKNLSDVDAQSNHRKCPAFRFQIINVITGQKGRKTKLVRELLSKEEEMK